MKYKTKIGMCSCNFEIEVDADTKKQLEKKVVRLIQERISEVWQVHAMDGTERYGELLHEFLVVRDIDRFNTEHNVGLMDPARFK